LFVGVHCIHPNLRALGACAHPWAAKTTQLLQKFSLPRNAKRTTHRHFTLYRSSNRAKSEFSLPRVNLLATPRNIGATALHQIPKFGFESASVPIYKILKCVVILPYFKLYCVLTDSMFTGKRGFIG
jgi:hypothetical protein